MLTYEDCIDYCNLTDELVCIFEKSSSIPAMQACIEAYELSIRPEYHQQLEPTPPCYIGRWGGRRGMKNSKTG